MELKSMNDADMKKKENYLFLDLRHQKKSAHFDVYVFHLTKLASYYNFTSVLIAARIA